MDTLDRLTLRGFKSIKDATIELRPLNVLIGANGAGKSNLISFFKMLNEMMGGRLQQFIAVSGRAHSLLHHGPKATPQMEASLRFRTDAGTTSYRTDLLYAAGDTLIVANEAVEVIPANRPDGPTILNLGGGSVETQIREIAQRGLSDADMTLRLLAGCRVYHFHDTSENARVFQFGYTGDNKYLKSDAGNLAAILYRLREEDPPAYHRIIGAIRLIAPFFDDFELSPASHAIILNWRDRASDQVFGPHQLSDGTLRAICLVTLLLQPEDDQPSLIVVDEPELGLHPYALRIVADLFQKASKHKQVLVSTQSSAFLDEFEPEDVIVVDRGPEGSTFARLDDEALASWLEEYTLGEIWEKNVVGGGPH